MVKYSICITYILYFIFFHVKKTDAQSWKIIDHFRNDHFFSQILYGNGTIKDSIIKTEQNENNCNTLKISYNLKTEPNTKCSVISNYDKATQDFSFHPSKFSFSFKGGNKTDKLRLRLWEDINMNGKFDENDELYSSPSFFAGNSNWQEQSFPIKSFKKVEGKGDNKLNLNRIRAWEIVIENSSNTISEGNIEISDLKFHTNYVPVNSNKVEFTGTFVALSAADSTQSGNWTEKKWIEELNKMKQLNINKVIIQYSIYQYIAWYTPCKSQQVSACNSALNKLFKAADQTNMQIIIGLSFSESWNKSDKSSAELYENLLTTQKQTIDELFTLFGSSNAFGGWYIPQEINDLEWQNDPNKALLFNWLQNTANYAHSKNKTKPVMIAPFFNLWQPADILEHWYDELLHSAPDINWIYPQDGVGTTRKAPDVDIPLYFNAIQNACKKNKRKFGATIESFQQTSGWPLNHEKFAAVAANPDRIKKQLQEAYRFTPNDIIIFEWRYVNLNAFLDTQKQSTK